jgi:hypothetical protein
MIELASVVLKFLALFFLPVTRETTKTEYFIPRDPKAVG